MTQCQAGDLGEAVTQCQAGDLGEAVTQCQAGDLGEAVTQCQAGDLGGSVTQCQACPSDSLAHQVNQSNAWSEVISERSAEERRVTDLSKAESILKARIFELEAENARMLELEAERVRMLAMEAEKASTEKTRIEEARIERARLEKLELTKRILELEAENARMLEVEAERVRMLAMEADKARIEEARIEEAGFERARLENSGLKRQILAMEAEQKTIVEAQKIEWERMLASISAKESELKGIENHLEATLNEMEAEKARLKLQENTRPQQLLPSGSDNRSSLEKLFSGVNLTSLDEVLHDYQFISVADDGDCYFLCVQYALRLEEPKLTIASLRKYCADQVDEEYYQRIMMYANIPDMHEEFGAYKTLKSLEHLKKAMLLKSYWADDQIVAILAERYSINVLIYTDHGSPTYAINPPNPDHRTMLLKLVGFHYEIITYEGEILLANWDRRSELSMNLRFLIHTPILKIEYAEKEQFKKRKKK